MAETSDDGKDFLDTLGPFKRWYQFGWRSPEILYKRLKGRYQPIFRSRMMWQRARRGWSEEDSWGLHYYLMHVISGSVQFMRNMPPHGHPNGVTYEEWSQILDEIVSGMEAAKIYDMNSEWPGKGEEAFNLAMNHLHKWFFSLWD